MSPLVLGARSGTLGSGVATMRVALADGWVDLDEGLVHRTGGQASLTETERALFRYLSDRPGQVVERAELLRKVWGYSASARTRTIDVTMRRLRAKVETDAADPQRLVTVTGRGYRFVPCAVQHTLVERDALLAELLQLSDGDVVLLTGPGGVGKTSLARTWLRGSGNGVDVELLGRHTLAEGMGALRDALGLGGEPTVDDALRHAVSEHQGRFLLDNVDDLEPAALLAFSELLGLHRQPVVATSRTAPRFEGERVLRVPLLSKSGSETLVARCLEEQGVAASAVEVAALARRTEGLPLAVELAAVRARALGAATLAENLPDHRLLVDARRTGHHRSLEVLLASSWEPLESSLKRSLTLLAGLSGPFDLHRAQVLLGPATAGDVATLQERSLVQRLDGKGPSQFRVLDAVRTFVRVRSQVSQEEWDACWERLARATEGKVFAEDPEHLALLHASRDDLLGVFARGTADRSDIGVLLYGALYFHERLKTLVGVLDDALAAPRPTRVAELLLYRAWCRRRLGDLRGALADGRRGYDVQGTSDRMRGEFRLLIGQCEVAMDPELGLKLLSEVADDEALYMQTRGMADTGRGHALRRLDRANEARDAYVRAADRLLGYPLRLRCAPLIGLGNLALAAGEPGEAEDAYREALDLAEQAQDAHTQAVLMANMGLLHLAAHRWEEAAQILGRAAEKHAWLGRTTSRMMARFGHGRALLLGGQLDEAHGALGTALALARRAERPAETCWIGLTLSVVEALRGRRAEATRLLDTDDGQTPALRHIADGILALVDGDHDAAETHLAQARAHAGPELEPEVSMLAERCARASG